MQFKTLHLALCAAILLLNVHINEAAVASDDLNAVRQAKTPITLEDILNGVLGSRGFGGSWTPGSDTNIRTISEGNVFEFNVDTKENISIVSASRFTEYLGPSPLAGLTFSSGGKHILVEHGRRAVWRHSSVAKFDIYDIDADNFVKLIPTGVPVEPQPELQLVRWSPSSLAVAFVYGNNIYFKKTPLAADPVQQITRDGGDNIFNGISDWVYEEEMFGSPYALWFSKDSNNLAFVKFDDTLVKTFQWPYYGEPGSRDDVYPEYEPIRYPKAGDMNPDVSMNVVALTAPFEVKTVAYPPAQNTSLQHYIATATWASDTTLVLINLNRDQTQATWHICNSVSAACTEIYSYTQTTPRGWIDVSTPIVSVDGTRMLTLQPVTQNDASRTTYTHIVSLQTAPGNYTAVSSGMMSVSAIRGWDERNNKVYFSATGTNGGVNEPSETHIYSVDGSGGNTTPDCLTCQQTNGAGEDCKSNTISFSANFTYYTHSCSGPGVPEIITKKTQDNSQVEPWVDNNELRSVLDTKLVPGTEELQVPLVGGFMAKVRLYLPPNFDANKKYPLLIDVYAGPNSQQITQGYGFNWGTYLTSSREIIYGLIDGRGSGRQSAELKFSVYKNLGSAEIEDQITVTKYLVQNKPFIDANKTAIWGWSYGGYATAMALGKDTEGVFKCGISVAPVSSWLYYDTIYTERYMGLPTEADNWANYNASSVMNHIENFKTKEFLLIHGNADDNVHYQNSMMLARALERADVMFSQLSYPDEAHSINGQFMRRHLYHSIERFLNQNCFQSNDDHNHDDDGNRNSGTSFILNLYAFMLTISVIMGYSSGF